MLMRRWGIFFALVLCCGMSLPALAATDLVVTGQKTLTPANLPACGFASITVAPGGVLTILTPLGVPPLTIKVQNYVDIAGSVRVLGATSALGPTPNGGGVVFCLPTGSFTVEALGSVYATVLDTNSVPQGNGGCVTVKADSIAIAGLIDADGSPTITCAHGGLIELIAKNVITVENPDENTTGTLATLSAKGYLGGIIRLLTNLGQVTLADTSLVDVRGKVGLPFSAACPYSDASLIDIESGSAVLLYGFRLYGVDNIAKGIGHLYVAARGQITVNPIPDPLLLAPDFAEYAEYSDTNLGIPPNHCAALLYTTTHLGNVVFTVNFNGPLEMQVSNAVDIIGSTLDSSLTVKAGGYVFLENGSAVGPVKVTACRIQVENFTLPVLTTLTETGKPVAFAGDTFVANEVFTTPCPLKLVGCNIGAGASITSEGPLSLTGTDVADGALLQEGFQWTFDFDHDLPVVAQILDITGGKMGNNITIDAERPPDYPTTTALTADITGTKFGTNLTLTIAGSLKATGITVGNVCLFTIGGDLKMTGCTFGTGTIHYTGALKRTGTKDSSIQYFNP